LTIAEPARKESFLFGNGIVSDRSSTHEHSAKNLILDASGSWKWLTKSFSFVSRPTDFSLSWFLEDDYEG